MFKIWRVFVVILLAVVTLLPLHAGGTTDVSDRQAWTEAIERDGLVVAFTNIDSSYPPFTWVILQGAAFLRRALAMDTFLALKWSLVAFLCITSILFFAWTRNFLLTVALHLSLILNSVALGYVDIYFAPPLILAFWALRQRKRFWFTVFYTVACLIKWQPLILGPFLALYLIRELDLQKWRTELPIFLRDTGLPAAVIIGGTLWKFGPAVLGALENAMNHAVLSGYALNYNWLLTHYLRLTQPRRFGPLADGIADYVDATDWSVIGFSKIAFYVFYAVALIVFPRRQRSFDDLLRFTIVGYLAYFTFNTGVHENHLFIAALLGVILYQFSPRDVYAALILVLSANLNLIVFYGFNGGATYTRQIGVDIALPLALFNVVFFLVLWVATCWRNETEKQAAATKLL